jgi:adenosylhomocysteine nucleosidase
VQSLGFITALPPEAGSLSRRRPGFGDLVALPGGHCLAVSGAGPFHAHQAALRLIGQGVAALVSWGCAAALDPRLNPGDLVLPERILGIDGSAYAVDAEWRDRLIRMLSPAVPTMAGALTESAHIVPGGAEKQALHAATGAIAVDMESAAIARLAHAHGLPFLAVRAVADTAAMKLPDAVIIALNPRGDVRLRKLLGYSVRHPAQFIELARLGRAFGAAMATLRHARSLTGNDCCFLPPPAGGLPS